MIIEATEDTPKIILDSNTGKMEISNRSLPEDAISFYQPVMDWIKIYSENPKSETNFIVKLEYYNTSSAKQIFRVLNKLEEFSERSKIEVNWYFHKDDKDMLYSGERYAKLVKLKFNLIEY